jgi:hypothetical protein
MLSLEPLHVQLKPWEYHWGEKPILECKDADYNSSDEYVFFSYFCVVIFYLLAYNHF